MEVILKHKFIGLLSVAFLMCASTTIAVHAENETTTVENPTTVIAVETTTPVAKTTTPAYVKSITVNKTIKVNKKASIKKDIKLNKTKLKNFTLVSNKTKVATISSSGKIKAKKAGKELSVEEAQLLAAAAEDEEAAMKEQARLREIPRELAVYEITGPLFFGAADRFYIRRTARQGNTGSCIG